MNFTIKNMTKEHWEEVKEIYLEGIETKLATFQQNAPTWEEWDSSHIKSCRLVACLNNKVIGWVALSPCSSRSFYSGVAEVSIYIRSSYKGNHVGESLLKKLINLSEENGFWTLESLIIKENIPSIKLHEKCGFRTVGFREKLGKMNGEKWMDVVIMEKRSSTVGID